MSKKQKVSENYLEKRPLRAESIEWTVDEKGLVTLNIENKGVFNRIAQKLFKKPKISYIHLDEMGSFVWPLLCKEKNIISIGEEVKEHFGKKAEPLYERLAEFFRILDSYHFIDWAQED